MQEAGRDVAYVISSVLHSCSTDVNFDTQAKSSPAHAEHIFTTGRSSDCSDCRDLA